MLPNFEYGCAPICDISVDAKSIKPEDAGARKRTYPDLFLAGRKLKTTGRFWESLHRRFGFTPNIFRYFSYAEVFNRISEVAKNDKIVYCIESKSGVEQLLGVASPNTSRITVDELRQLLDRHPTESISYDNGLITSRHPTRHGGEFDIAGDAYESKFVVETPIDGFGRPSVYLSMMRLVCLNGAVALSSAFRSDVNLGRGNDRCSYALTRVLEGFNNDEGFAALRQRFDSAASSWSSVLEAQRFRRLLVTLHSKGQLIKGRTLPKVRGADGSESASASPILTVYDRLMGDLTGVYGMANLDGLSPKRQRTLPAGCKVYELLNFASEVATHHATAAGNRLIQGFIGELVSNEYDLEGTANDVEDWRDFFITSPPSATTAAGRKGSY